MIVQPLRGSTTAAQGLLQFREVFERLAQNRQFTY
jgi:hypothetical protein